MNNNNKSKKILSGYQFCCINVYEMKIIFHFDTFSFVIFKYFKYFYLIKILIINQ